MTINLGVAKLGEGVFLDTTILKFASDLRGIHQVVFRMVEILANDPRFNGIIFLAAPGTYETYLKKLGVKKEQIVELAPFPILGRFERFHGIFSTFRYRNITSSDLRLLIHSEIRSVIRTKIPQAVCFYDFIELEKDSQESQKFSRRIYYHYKAKIASRVKFKLAISEYTKKSALNLFPRIDPNSFQVVHLGLRKSFSINFPIHKASVETPIFLYVGSFDPRKNIAALLLHFSEVIGAHNGILHLVGRIDQPVKAALISIVNENRISHLIQWHGLISDEKLSSLYASAHFLLFPSLKEGFGLPLVEAMAHGVVVCAFQNSAIPEIVNDVGILSTNNDFVAWGEQIDKLVRNPSLYQDWSERAKKRAGYFSAENAKERLSNWFVELFETRRS